MYILNYCFSVVLAIVCAVLMGISDGILFISVVSLLGIIYPENSVESMSLFMFGMVSKMINGNTNEKALERVKGGNE